MFLAIVFIICSSSAALIDWSSSQQRPYFVCQSGAFLDQTRICDGRRDCQDGSDERRQLCAHTMCPPASFRCHDGACVPRSRWCDGVRDCADGTDEDACGRRRDSCAHSQFRCKRSGRCIPAVNVCDGHADCPFVDYLYDAVDVDDANSDEAAALCTTVPDLCPRDAFRCTYGGCVRSTELCDGFADCLDASDESAVICMARDCAECREAMRCPAINVRRMDAVCQQNGMAVKCSRPVPIGTTATYSCKEFFEPTSPKHQKNDMSVCQLDGTWSRSPLQCQPICGRRNIIDAAAALPLVVRGQEVDEPFPWHASIYVQRPTSNGSTSYRFWCGATLITEAVAITAAHCVWGLPATAMRLVIGSTSSHYFEEEEIAAKAEGYSSGNSSNAQSDYNRYERMLTVRRSIVHPLYQDRIGNYGSDIALLELNGTVQLGVAAMPVCIDWKLDDITEHLQLGYVMGLGVTEQQAYSERLRWTALPVVGHKQCLERQRPDFRKYVTFTTFCAGWANGTAVCNGDSGGGLVFKTQGSSTIDNDDEAADVDDDIGFKRGFKNDFGGNWYLQGIVSLSPRSQHTSQCDPYAYTIFTKVGMYVQWIRKVLDQIHENHDIMLEENPI